MQTCTSMLYTQDENLNNGEDPFFLLFKSQREGPDPIGPLDTRLREDQEQEYMRTSPRSPQIDMKNCII